MRFILLITLIPVFAFPFASPQGLTCRDDKNQPVDWYVLYKIPKLDSFWIPDVRKGRGYMYITSESLSDSWVISANSIFGNSSAFANTLSPYYKNNQSEVWLLYNDQPPGGRSKTGKAHAKGVIGGNREGGFWLVHSVPHFPSTLPKYTFPSTGVKYGQSFLCISLSPTQLDSLGSTVLDYYGPNFYDTRLSQEMITAYPSLANVVWHGASPHQPPNAKFILTSLKSNQFEAFAKTKTFSEDLYEWAAEDLRVDLLSETWLNGEGALSSECTSPNKVMNIRSISFKNIKFNSSHDHSKWAASIDKSKPYVCVGDINRAKTQEQRGGGSVCISNPDLWKNYNILPSNVEACPKNHHERQQDYHVNLVK